MYPNQLIFGIPDDVVRAVVWDNASRLYSVTGPAMNAT